MGVEDSTEVTGFTVIYEEYVEASVSTDPADSVDYKSGTLNGELTELNVSDVDAYFEYRETGESEWETTNTQNLSSAQTFSDSVTDLADDTEFEFRAVADDTEGNRLSEGSTETFTTDAVETTVSTDPADNITTDGADLNGELTNLGDGLSDVEVYFEYRETGAGNWDETSTQTISSAQTFSETVTGLTDDTEHEFRAIVQDTDGYQLDEGSTNTFTTESSTADFQVTIDSTRDPFHQEFYVEVDVENTGNGEGTQTITLDYEGSQVDSEELTLAVDETDTVTLTHLIDPSDGTGTKNFEVASDNDTSSSTAVLQETHVLDAPSNNQELRGSDVTFEWDTRFNVTGQVRLFYSEDVETIELSESNADFTDTIESGDLASGTGSNDNSYSETFTVGQVDGENWTVTFETDQ